MSIKTLRKRIALVAVSALGAGLLSVAPASAAVEADDVVVKTATGIYNSAADMCANTTTGSAQSAVIPLTSAGLFLTTAAGAASERPYMIIDGPGRFIQPGTLIDSVSGTLTRIGLNWDLEDSVTLRAVSGNLTGSDAIADRFAVKPTGTGTISVYLYNAAGTAAVDVITVTVVASCDSDSLSLAKSYYTSVAAADAITGWTATKTDTAGSSRIENAGSGYIHVQLNDAYGNNLVTSAAFVVTAAGDNCRVGINAADSAVTGYTVKKTNTDVASSIMDDHIIRVTAASALKPASCTVSATFGGTSVGSKSFVFEGPVAKVTVSDVMIASTTSTTGRYRVKVEDAAGNRISGVAIDFSSTETNNAAAIASGVIASPQARGSLSTADDLGAAADGQTPSVLGSGYAYYTCNKEGSAKITVRALADSATGTYVTSDPFAVVCSGILDTWSISLDKAQYAPGEIATLTVSGKSVGGNPVFTLEDMTGVAYSFGGMTAVTAPTTTDVFSSGAGTKTYTFSVGTTEGAFVGSFTVTGETDTKAKTVQYKIVAPATGAVSNAEVLAAIVKLIASINKQIRALQKSLKR